MGPRTQWDSTHTYIKITIITQNARTIRIQGSRSSLWAERKRPTNWEAVSPWGMSSNEMRMVLEGHPWQSRRDGRTRVWRQQWKLEGFLGEFRGGAYGGSLETRCNQILVSGKASTSSPRWPSLALVCFSRSRSPAGGELCCGLLHCSCNSHFCHVLAGETIQCLIIKNPFVVVAVGGMRRYQLYWLRRKTSRLKEGHRNKVASVSFLMGSPSLLPEALVESCLFMMLADLHNLNARKSSTPSQPSLPKDSMNTL